MSGTRSWRTIWAGGSRATPVLIMLLIACQPSAEIPEIVIGGLDYSFDIPSEIPAGRVQISFENRGQVPHEAILVELNPGTTMTDMVQAVESGTDPDELVQQFGGILIADPGEKTWGRLYVELIAGRTYGLVCSFVDEEGDPPHIAMGMLRTFTVIDAS